MALNSVAPLQALRTMVQNLTGMQGTVSIGQPESIATRVTAWVAMGSHDLQNKTTSTRIRRGRFVVFLSYRVGGDESTAELLIAALTDLLEQAILDDQTLSGTVNSARIISAGSELPEYLVLAAQEMRLFPIVVETDQQTLYAQ